ADEVDQQRATGAAAGGVDAYHRDAHLREAGQEAVEQLVGDGALARAAGAGDADHRRGARVPGGACGPLLAQHGQLGVGAGAVLDGREHAADGDLVKTGVRVDFPGMSRQPRVPGGKSTLTPVFLAGAGYARHHVLDHLHQAQLHAVVGVVDAFDAIGFQFTDLLWGDGAAAATEHADVARAAFAQHVDHVPEVFDVAALVGRQGDGV